MEIVIINLKSSLNRKKFQQKQAEELSLKVAFFDAVSTCELCEEKHRALYDTWERPLSKAEVCCFLSHKAVWEKVIEGGEPILILEDDAVLSRDIKQLLFECKHLKKIDRINLESRIKKKSVSKKRQSVFNHRIMKVFIDRSGAAGYILYPSGAKKLLHKYQKTAALADKVERSCNLIMYQVEPSAVMPLDYCHHFGVETMGYKASETTIGNDDFGSITNNIRTLMRCRFRRCIAQFRLVKQTVRSLFFGERRFIEVQKLNFMQVSDKLVGAHKEASAIIEDHSSHL